MVSTRVWKHQQFGFVPHTSVSGETWTLTLSGRCTTGAAGGTTLVDTQAASGAAHTYAGRYWVRITQGPGKGLWKRVVADDGAGTLTLENNGFPEQLTNANWYELWKSPEPVVVIDSSSGETNAVDAVRAEADDFWNGFYLVPINGTHRGKIVQISDFVSSSGTFTLASGLGSALSAGDVCLLRRFVDVTDVSDGLEEAYEDQAAYRIGGDIGDGRVLNKGGTFGFSSEIIPPDVASGDGVDAPACDISYMLPACGFDEVVNESVELGAGSTTSALEGIAGSWENVGIGTMVIVDSSATWVQSTADGATDTINVEPSLPFAPATGEIAYAARTYRRNRPSRDGDYRGITIEHERDGIRTTMTGCRGNVVLNDGPVLMLAWQFNVDHWVREIERAPYYAGASYSSTPPVKGADKRVYFDDTAVSIGGLTASLNNEVAPKNVQGAEGVNGRAGYGHINAMPGATFRQLFDTTEELERYEDFLRRNSFALYVAYGDKPGRFFGLRIALARVAQDPKPEDAGGLIDHPVVLRAHDAGVTTDGGGTSYVVDDFSFHI